MTGPILAAVIGFSAGIALGWLSREGEVEKLHELLSVRETFGPNALQTTWDAQSIDPAPRGFKAHSEGAARGEGPGGENVH